jgi:plastocyanin
VACLLLVMIVACGAGASAQPTPRPNEVQVLEPAGKEEQWSYTPLQLTVSQGTTVTFVNHGKEFHTVTSDDATRPFDVAIDSGKSATITFDKVGAFRYHCGVHPQMKGIVRVCAGACG